MCIRDRLCWVSKPITSKDRFFAALFIANPHRTCCHSGAHGVKSRVNSIRPTNVSVRGRGAQKGPVRRKKLERLAIASQANRLMLEYVQLSRPMCEIVQVVDNDRQIDLDANGRSRHKYLGGPADEAGRALSPDQTTARPSPQAVSYTHLDVYKRQGMHHG